MYIVVCIFYNSICIMYNVSRDYAFEIEMDTYGIWDSAWSSSLMNCIS